MPNMLDALPDELTTEEVAIRHAALDGVDAMRRAGASLEDCVHCLAGLSLHLIGELPLRERAEHIAVVREMLDWCATELVGEADLENKRRS